MIDKLIPRLTFAIIGLAWAVFSYATIVGMMRFGFNLSAALAIVVPAWLIIWMIVYWRKLDREWLEGVERSQPRLAEYGYRQDITGRWATGQMGDEEYHRLRAESDKRLETMPPLWNRQG